MGALQVSHGDQRRSTNSEAITFGRSSKTTLRLDHQRPDESLSRVTGAFRRLNSRWALYNESDRLDLHVALEGGIRATIAPGGWPLGLPASARGTVTIQTKLTYVVRFETPPEPPSQGGEPATPEGLEEGPLTLSIASSFQLSAEELTMLAVLCEDRLRHPLATLWEVPPVSVVSDRLAITPKRAEKLVDAIAQKFAQAVEGLIGDNRGRATDRRRKIAEFALATGCVTVADLRLLPRRIES